MDELETKIFEIISFVGEGRAKAFEAIGETKKGNDDAADKLLQEAKAQTAKAHHIQTELVQDDLAGKTKISLLLVHAQDQLMTFMSEYAIIEQLLEIIKDMRKKNNC
ncbi:MAG: PTS lactose/cellobiose transporter subunit IIA [Bifidobacteriaceae bacterium]|jgi:PTS system cellobiose-specific IIA component|nr:PTS lactose/cellobiose transporter subunit IIA [Bifidobacteriaceae bacterium]